MSERRRHLEAHSIIVTGAARGIGEAIASAIAAEGTKVVLADVDERVTEVAQRLRSAGSEAIALVGSVADMAYCESLVATASDHFGGLNGLVNNAGVIHEAHFWEDRSEDMRRLLEVNVLGVMQLGAAAGSFMKAHGGGAIVNMTSGASRGFERYAAYAGSKGAISSLTYTWALEGAEHGIRVNAIAPFARTYMSTFSEFQRATVGSAPDPSRVGPLATYLLSDRSQGISGQVFRLGAHELGLMSHPANVPPVVPGETWDFETLARAVDDVLAPCLQRVGRGGWSPPRLAGHSEE